MSGRLRAADAPVVLTRLRAEVPRVHVITNSVAQAFTANVLLAAGAQPSMTLEPAELPGFLAGADVLAVNLGTLDAVRCSAIHTALTAAEARNLPWVLDPVMAERSPPRLDFSRELITRHPAILRGNAAELAVLAGTTEPAALERFARDSGVVIWRSGPQDSITDGTQNLTVANGHPLMSRVTAMGCAATALAAACLAVERDPLAAAVAAALIFAVAGELAGEAAAGPGSFAVAFLDNLAALDQETLLIRSRLT